MIIHWYDDCVRLTGRWSRLVHHEFEPHDYVQPPTRCTSATAAGSYFELAFTGKTA